jgi:hypothetical protein
MRPALALLLLCLSPGLPAQTTAERVRQGAETAHAELWKRFVDEHGVLIDYTDLDGKVNLPTPEECRAGKPNALGWFQPIENGAMFNGLYMDAAVLRWRLTKAPADAEKARKLMQGLLLLNSISDVKGFVGRGVTTDGKSHFPMGSNDQTGPWFTGLWRYLQDGPVTPDERTRIVRHLTETAEAIVALDWKMPAEQPFGTRGSFKGHHFEEITRRAFVCRLMHQVTGEDRWATAFRDLLAEKDPKSGQTYREILREGMKFWYSANHNWTSCCAVIALRGLWETETDANLKADWAEGLAASARLASGYLKLIAKYDPQATPVFSNDWRKAMLPLWKEQRTEKDAADLAGLQIRAFQKISPAVIPEFRYVREAAAAAWIVTLAPDGAEAQAHREALAEVITRPVPARLHYCTFFWIEAAAYRLSESPAR